MLLQYFMFQVVIRFRYLLRFFKTRLTGSPSRPANFLPWFYRISSGTRDGELSRSTCSGGMLALPTLSLSVRFRRRST